jgi:lantibiotic modifying enzyme
MYALKADAFELLRKAGRHITYATPHNDSLISGSLGLALYHYHAGTLFGANQDISRAQGLIKNALDRLNNVEGDEFPTSFASGLAGFCYAFNYFSGRKFIDFDVAEFAELDEYLLEMAISLVRRKDNDYLHGAFGILHYFLSRDKSPFVEKCIGSILDEIHENIHCKEDYFIQNEFHEDVKNKVDFGLAHGQAGLLLILLQAVEEGYDVERTLGLVNNCISFLLKHLQEPIQDKYSYFPIHVDKESGGLGSLNRLAWCYGDLNICLLLYRMANFLDNSRYRKVADLVGLSSIMRVSPEATLCTDSHFCHGSSGIAELYRAFYFMRPLPEYENAYHFWIRKTVDFLRSELDKGAYINKETNLLEGLVGPTLSLLSFVSEEKLDWQKLLLLP